MARLPIVYASSKSAQQRAGGAGHPGWLADPSGRKLRYLRLSVTDRCDLRCQYCMPPKGVPASPRSEFLTFEEIVRLVKAFCKLGVSAVRITGGEPLIRTNITHLVDLLRNEAGVEDLAMTTNATLLSKYADQLVKAGLRRVNVSLDSLEPKRFEHMTRGGQLKRVLAGIDAALKAGLSVKTNSVVVRGSNDHELANLVSWAWSRNITPRFIELMPLGEGAKLGPEAVVSVKEMQQKLEELALDDAPQFESNHGPASYWLASDGSQNRVGFIGAVTENFCSRCNRVRVTARGEIKACLASPSGLSLREVLRSTPSTTSDRSVVHTIEQALFGKSDGHRFYDPQEKAHHRVDMSRIGG